MKTSRKTEITVETERVLVIRGTKQARLTWCPSCAEQVKMVTPEQASAIARVTARTIYRWVEAEKLHFAETPAGWLLVCLNSLLDPN